ncbi:NACHT domain-containing protein [Streptomyces sp. NPDC059618]|uniref:NACHT domain-containing protein n=1 Tax=Streptomyces sp. NPDC059618 TaxID=3346887 RepID=UPI0036AE1747
MILYLNKQYEDEESLRFKQVEIDPIPVLNHFVDTPVLLQQRGQDIGYLQDLLESIDPDTEMFEWEADEDGYLVKAAELFLNEKFVEGFRKVVLEGAPGQGKTTLVQYIGQIHRARILHRADDLKSVPAKLITGPLRLPIRIELRHLGAWLQGESPWPSSPGSASGQPPYLSIPSFISAQAAYATGGLELTANDVIAIMAKTPSLLMLDGLDEVPDAEVRSHIVDMAEGFIKDLHAFGADVQVIVTSRPSASTKSAVFSRQGFKYLELADLTEKEIWEYADDWIARKKIAHHESETFRSVLGECLQKRHVADLARNPMQLAILLWLVHVRDWSLPDKRTALYDQYMSTFLDREATKDPVVRQNRTILLELHGHIAWILHARSEHEKSSGSGDISKDELKQLMRAYLEGQEEEEPDELIDVLFRGVQRVFALTERIQGRFEFEIQSMREFFAGTYLYKTAPHYSNASEVRGSRPDRLEALIRNPYWLNVVRFFCGWYDKGELADLSRRLVDLCEAPDYRRLSHPRELVASLLGDHVTHASKRDTRQLADQLTDPLSLRSVGSSLSGEVVSSSISPNSFILPAMANEAMKIYPSIEADEVAYEISAVLRSQVSPSDRFLWWIQSKPAPEEDGYSAWLRSGSILQAFCGAPVEDVSDALNLSSGTEESWIRCCEAGRLDVALSQSNWFEPFFDRLGAGQTVLSYPENPEGKYIHEVWQLLTLELPFRITRRPSELTLGLPKRHPRFHKELASLLRLFECFLDDGSPEFSQTVQFALESHAIFGAGCWASWRTLLGIAPVLSAVGGRGKSGGIIETVVRCWDKRTDLEFWQDFLQDETLPLMPRVAAFISWAPARAFHSLQAKIISRWEHLQPWQMSLIQKRIEMQHLVDAEGFASCRFTSADFRSLPKSLPGCMLPSLEARFDRNYATPLMIDACSPCFQHASLDHAYRISQLVNVLGRGKIHQLDKDLSRIRTMFPTARSSVSSPLPRAVTSLYGANRLPARFVEEILKHPFEFPFVLVDAAQQAANATVIEKMPSLTAISDRERWFA